MKKAAVVSGAHAPGRQCYPKQQVTRAQDSK